MSEPQPACDVPGCERRARYRFAASGNAPADRCPRHAVVYRPVFRRALRVAALVGTALFLINQADVVLGGDLSPLVAAKIALTYAVPFSVSTYSALAANRLPAPDQASGGLG